MDGIDDGGYDFYIASKLDNYERDNLYNPNVTGVDFMEKCSFENIYIPKQTYVIFETERSKSPINQYIDIRQKVVSEWLPISGYQFANSPELALLHWRPKEDRKNRYVEIWLPIEKK